MSVLGYFSELRIAFVSKITKKKKKKLKSKENKNNFLPFSLELPMFLQMNLLDRAVKMVAELDEPEEQNYVRKHATEQAQALGIEVREAATRVFSNASGSYSSNINLAVENSSWNDEKQLQDMYLSRKSFAFDSDAPGVGMTEKRQVFEMALSTADATFQNLDSSEISLTDVSHYFDSDPTNLVQNLRKDGKKPSAYIADTTTANAQVSTLM